jgi:cell division protein FtsW (lipid II flippase)
VGLQAFLNIAVVSNTIPNTVISLPFFSYGGTSLMMLLAQMGVILNISRHAMLEEDDGSRNMKHGRSRQRNAARRSSGKKER